MENKENKRLMIVFRRLRRTSESNTGLQRVIQNYTEGYIIIFTH